MKMNLVFLYSLQYNVSLCKTLSADWPTKTLLVDEPMYPKRMYPKRLEKQSVGEATCYQPA